jgi:hypothetical protein
MSFTMSVRKLVLCVLCGLFALFIVSSTAQAQAPNLILTIGDTTATAGAEDAYISVFLDNWVDTVWAFELHITTNDLATFRTDILDTTYDTIWEYCAQWNGSVCEEYRDTVVEIISISSASLDTAGTLISGWPAVSAFSEFPSLRDIKVTGFSNPLGGGGSNPGLLPQGGTGVPLLRLRFRVKEDLSEQPDSTAYFSIVPEVGETSFSAPGGETNVGTTTDTLGWQSVDTSFKYCAIYDQGSCVYWRDTTEAAAESTFIDTIWILNTIYDYDYVLFNNGSVVIQAGLCGDANSDQAANISDAVFLINHVFKGGPAPESCDDANCNGDATLNISDAVYIVNHIFKGGPPPVCAGCV